MKKNDWVVIGILLLFPIVGIRFYPYLPDQIATHWGGSDTPDGYMSKFAGTFITAALLMVFIVINLFMTKLITRKSSNRKPFLLFYSILISLSIFLLFTYIIVLAWNAGADFSVPKVLLVSSIVLVSVVTILPVLILTRKGDQQEKTISEPKVDVLDSAGNYTDKLVEILDDEIVFKDYYFPIGSKRVKLSEVAYIEEMDCTLRNGKWRLHGTGDLLFRIWFPADYERPSRDKIYVMKVTGKWVKIGFTVENSNVVSDIFNAKGLLNRNNC